MSQRLNSADPTGSGAGAVERLTSPLLAALRRLAKTPGFRVLARNRFLTRMTAAMRGTLMVERLRFARNELRPKDVVETYHVATTGAALRFRHHTPDLTILDEVFSQRLYELPPPVEGVLAELGRPPVVVDLGANIGLFGVFVIGIFPDARLVAFEPDRHNAAVLKDCIAANDAADRWELIQACAATEDGTLLFRSGDFATSQVVSQDEPQAGVEQVPARDVFPFLESVDLLKMDMEGSEWALMEDARFRRIPAKAVVLEYHGDACSTHDATTAAAELLESAGYEVAPLFYDAELDVGMLWGWREPVDGASVR